MNITPSKANPLNGYTYNGDIDFLKTLLAAARQNDPNAVFTTYLQQAAALGDKRAVEFLISVCGPNINYGEALLNAVCSDNMWNAICLDNIECAKILVPLVNVTDCTEALQKAVEYRLWDMVDVLFEASDPHIVLHNLMTEYPSEPEYWRLLEDEIGRRQKHVLQSHITTGGSTRARKI